MQRILEGTHDAVIGVVEDSLERERLLPVVGGCLRGAARPEQPPDLARQHIPVLHAENVADDMLRLAVAIEGSGVEVADTRIVGVEDDHAGIGIVYRFVDSAERRASKPHRGKAQRRAADRPCLELHAFPLRRQMLRRRFF